MKILLVYQYVHMVNIIHVKNKFAKKSQFAFLDIILFKNKKNASYFKNYVNKINILMKINNNVNNVLIIVKFVIIV